MIYTWIIYISWVVFILYWLVSAFNVKRDLRRGFFWNSSWLRLIILCVAIAWLSESPLAQNKIRLIQISFAHAELLPLAAIVTVLGIGFAVWARIHLGRNWSPIPNIKEGQELVTSGPYQFVRHPIYTGILLAALGTALISPSWIFIFCVALGMFIWRVHKEESLMTSQFPDQYPEYRKHTYALIPWVW